LDGLAGITRDNLLRSLEAARPGFLLYHGNAHNGVTAFPQGYGAGWSLR
jgi:hypothetical protein